MNNAERNQHPIQILFNYWEVRPTCVGARLDEFIRHGVTHISTFVPWQAVESDIAHTLVRFLQSVSERKMTVNLILTPEVGIHYAHSGLPKDVMSRAIGADTWAAHSGSGPVSVTLAPNAFHLPSLFSPEFTKRYYSFLSRMDSLLADIERNSPQVFKRISVVLTGSFWKYYRSPQVSSDHPYVGLAGDCSSSAGLAYRQRVEQLFSQREFSDPNPMAANRWKTRAMEEVNRRWFHQQSEDVFRNRTFQFVRKKAADIKVMEMELHTPEADPAMVYSNVLTLLSGGHGDFAKLSALVDEASARASYGSASETRGYIHWTSLGGFRSLADPEKQFLILKTLLLMGGQGGGVLIDESEWFSLSQNFRTRVESFAKSLASGDLKLKTRALYLAPHLWSGAGTLWTELFHRVGAGAQLISSLDFISKTRGVASHSEAAQAALLIVDPSWILSVDSVRKLADWASGGRVVVLPRSPLYTAQARQELERLAAQGKQIEIDLGVTYRVNSLGEGKLIIYDLPENLSMSGETLSSWRTFLTAILSVAEVQSYCRMSDSRLAMIPLEKKGQGLGLFILNSTRRAVSADILFPEDVVVSDLAVALASAQWDGSGLNRAAQVEAAPASRFSLDVPPCGILPLAVDGLGLYDSQFGARDRQLAAESSLVTRSGAEDAAMSELPGYQPNSQGSDLWS
ncbi:hypothetical protein WDW37_08630 [Bdellovibrionota bacterium FG-1]